MRRLSIVIFLFLLALVVEWLVNHPEQVKKAWFALQLPEIDMPEFLEDRIPDWKAPPDPASARGAVLAAARGEIGVRERTGKNDGEVEKYIRSVGMDPKAGLPYCAAFVYWCGREAGLSSAFPRSAWSPDFLENPDWRRGKGGPDPEGGDVFGIYYSSKERIAHAGFVESLRGRSIVTIEGNTSSRAAFGSAADREGQGVYRKIRPLSTVYAVKRWLP